MCPRGPKRSADRAVYPPRFHVKPSGKCYHVTSRQPRKWTEVGTTADLPDALKRWAQAERLGASESDATFAGVALRFCAVLEDPHSKLHKKLALRTRQEYLRLLRADPPSVLQKVFGKMPMADIRTDHVATFLDKHKHPTAANRQIQLLSVLFRWCIRFGLHGIKENPCLIERNPESHRDTYVSNDLYIRVWRFAWDSDPKQQWRRFAAAMDISLITGWREGEVLRIHDGRWDEHELRGSETKDPRKRMRVPMIPALRSALERAASVRRVKTRRVVVEVEHLHSPLFLARGRKPLSVSGFKAGWGRMMRAAIAAGVLTPEERFHFHDIRAKHASDRDDDLAQLALGHTSPRMTAAYMRHPLGRKYPALDAPAAGGCDPEDAAKEAEM